MDIKQDNEIMSNDEVNLYDYWKVIVKRKKIFLGIFLVPLMIVTIVSLIMPRYYRGVCEVSIPAILPTTTSSALTAPNIINLIGNIDDAKKIKIFANNAAAIKNVSISLSQKATDKVSIIIDAKNPDIIPEALKSIFDYINNLPDIKEEIAKPKKEIDLKLKTLLEAKKANLVFLNHIMDLIKKRQLTFMTINPADLIEKDADLSLKIKNLEQAKTDMIKKRQLLVSDGNTATLNKNDADLPAEIKIEPPSITKQPNNAQVKKIIIFTGLLTLFADLVIVFFLEYIEKMKAREKKKGFPIEI